VSKKLIPPAGPHRTAQICALCRRTGLPLHLCSLVGNGEHTRSFLLCADCIRCIETRTPSARNALPPAAPTIAEAEKRQETRRQKAFERLGTDQPICACCGETDWRCMELHHLEGEQFGKTLVTVCRNCHRKLSDAQRITRLRSGSRLSPANVSASFSPD
jgi:hypothetical protein